MIVFCEVASELLLSSKGILMGEVVYGVPVVPSLAPRALEARQVGQLWTSFAFMCHNACSCNAWRWAFLARET